MKNKLTDLNDHLFAQLERLSDEKLTSDQIGAEVRRSEALVQVADRIVDNARLQLAAFKLVAENAGLKDRLPSAMALPAGGSPG